MVNEPSVFEPLKVYCKLKWLTCNGLSSIFQSDDVETPYGNIRVAIQGDRAKPAILTYHDIGLNRKYFQMMFLLDNLTLLHSERPKLYAILAFLSAIGLNKIKILQVWMEFFY